MLALWSLAALALWLAPAEPAADLKAQAVLDRAVVATGGQALLDSLRQLRIVSVGTQDLSAIYQGHYSEKATPERRQQTLVLDLDARRGALRTEGVQSDGTPSLWKETVLGDAGYSYNIKTQKVFERAGDWADATWSQWLWSLPHLALKELQAQRGALRFAGSAKKDGRELDVLSLMLENRPAVKVSFDRKTGLLDGYEFEAPYVEGRTTFEYLFKPYRPAPGLGVFPSGIRQRVGGTVFRDLDVFDARLAPVDKDDPWLTPLPAGTGPGTVIPSQKRRAETVAPGVSVLRNVGGYNVLIAALGDCIAVVDAPASFASPGPLPPASPPPDLSQDVLDMAAGVFPGKKICWVIPTHHHGDHFGGIGPYVRAGAAVLTTPGNGDLARRVIEYGVKSSGNWTDAEEFAPRVETFAGKKVLGEGDARLEVYAVPGTRHAEEMLFVYFPAHGIAFEGDLGDYVLAAKRFLQFAEENKLAIDKVYGVHDSDFWTLDDAREDDPSN